jgi:predicted nucleic acid-binding protein
VIFDTNILIYFSKNILSPTIVTGLSAISVVTKIEALGYPFPNKEEHEILSQICDVLHVVPLTDEIAEKTIELRKKYRIKLADAIIYSTALIEKKPFLTNNIQDFKSLNEGVELINPFSV